MCPYLQLASSPQPSKDLWLLSADWVGTHPLAYWVYGTHRATRALARSTERDAGRDGLHVLDVEVKVCPFDRDETIVTHPHRRVHSCNRFVQQFQSSSGAAQARSALSLFRFRSHRRTHTLAYLIAGWCMSWLSTPRKRSAIIAGFECNCNGILTTA